MTQKDCEEWMLCVSNNLKYFLKEKDQFQNKPFAEWKPYFHQVNSQTNGDRGKNFKAPADLENTKKYCRLICGYEKNKKVLKDVYQICLGVLSERFVTEFIVKNGQGASQIDAKQLAYTVVMFAYCHKMQNVGKPPRIIGIMGPG
jgi:hypothetical protein